MHPASGAHCPKLHANEMLQLPGQSLDMRIATKPIDRQTP